MALAKRRSAPASARYARQQPRPFVGVVQIEGIDVDADPVPDRRCRREPRQRDSLELAVDHDGGIVDGPLAPAQHVAVAVEVETEPVPTSTSAKS
jgi:hypothetical protein